MRHAIWITGGLMFLGTAWAEKPGAKPEEAIPLLRDVLETHRLDVDNGVSADELSEWVHDEQPKLQPAQYGFQEFTELLNYAQDKGLVRIQADEERGLTVYLGAIILGQRAPRPHPNGMILPRAQRRLREITRFG